MVDTCDQVTDMNCLVSSGGIGSVSVEAEAELHSAAWSYATARHIDRRRRTDQSILFG